MPTSEISFALLKYGKCYSTSWNVYKNKNVGALTNNFDSVNVPERNKLEYEYCHKRYYTHEIISHYHIA